MIRRCGEIADFDPSETIPMAICSRITQPILLVHGSQDEKINIAYSRQNYDSLASLDKTFLEIEGAAHTNIWEVGGKDYFKKAFRFLIETSEEQVGSR